MNPNDTEARHSFITRLHSFGAEEQRNLLRIESDEEIEILKDLALEIAHFEVAYVLREERERRRREKPACFINAPTANQIAAAAFVAAWSEFSKQTHAINRDKGFGMPEGASVLWDGNQICMIHGEVSEAHEGLRKDAMDDKLLHRKSVEVELADAVIRIMNYGRERGLDIAGAITEKSEFNATRPYMHGNKLF